MTKITKAMILAAGLGTRLRPLTYETPKPLLPLGDMHIIDYPLQLLKRGGIEEVVINLHHLGEQIREYVGNGSRYGFDVRYSEEPTILGTGGGIRKALESFGDGPFAVVNSDALMDIDLDDVTRHHYESGAAATLVLKSLGPEDTYQAVSLDENGFVTGFDNKGRHFYVGLQVVTKEFLSTLPPAGTEFCLIASGYKPFIENGGKVASFIYDGYFNDVGTVKRYEQAQSDCLHGVCAAVITPM
jgi:NDP-sugar pyrophosphorylase family protein